MVLQGPGWCCLPWRSEWKVTQLQSMEACPKSRYLESAGCTIFHPHVQLQCHIPPRRRNQHRARRAAAVPRAERWRRIPARLLQDVPSQLQIGLARTFSSSRTTSSCLHHAAQLARHGQCRRSFRGPFSRGTAAGQSCRFLGCRLHCSLRLLKTCRVCNDVHLEKFKDK